MPFPMVLYFIYWGRVCFWTLNSSLPTSITSEAAIGSPSLPRVLASWQAAHLPGLDTGSRESNSVSHACARTALPTNQSPWSWCCYFAKIPYESNDLVILTRETFKNETGEKMMGKEVTRLGTCDRSKSDMKDCFLIFNFIRQSRK